MANFFDLFTGNIQEEAARQKQAGLQAGYQQYSDLATQGRDALTSNYTDALRQFQGLQPTATSGYNLYADITGANGPEGQARARAMFQTDPGYQFARSEGEDAIARAGAARGVAAGNTAADTARFTSGLASKQYGDWVSRVAPWLQQAPGLAGQTAGLYTGLGTGLAGSYGNQGQAAFGTQKGIGEAQAEGTMGQLTGLQNIAGLGMNLATLGANVYGANQAATLGKSLMGGLQGQNTNPLWYQSGTYGR